MELRVLLVLCLCVCLLTSPTLATVAIANAVAQTAISKATAIVGAGVALKTAAVKAIGTKALAGVALKAAAVKGVLALKGAAVVLGVKGLAAFALKAAALKGALIAKGVIQGKTALISAAAAKVGAALLAKSSLLGALTPSTPSKIPTIFDIISGASSIVQSKQEMMGDVIDKMTGQPEIIVQGPPVLYEYITQPRVYYETVPVIEEIEY
ncbi:antifreeze protein Maxi-like [Maniola hyperantus]|uniref:antifreeze protein Maxi-like n=1 Tax=Aphantopus hyperantus TaxID=2795564 RepID=UPI003749B676